MRDQLDFIVAERTENHARLLLVPREGSEIVKITGAVRGPYSDFSKTLTSDSAFKAAIAPRQVEALVVDPCYWIPSLPFWYDLRVTLELNDRSTREEVIPLGIKRFYCERRNFLLEGKRVVLRGMGFDSPNGEQLQSARKFEAALMVGHVAAADLQQASRLGVPLVVDLRESNPAASAELDWHAAVMLVLVDVDQARAVQLRNTHVAICVSTDSDEPAVSCDAYAIELSPGERPPAWAATCDKPVIAIRKDPGAEIRTARAGCDKLQAELAPEFDLAGYFV